MKLIELNEHYYLLSNDEIKDGRENFWTYDHLNKKPLHISHIEYFKDTKFRDCFKTVEGTSSGTRHKEIVASTDSLEGLPKISMLSLIELWKGNEIDIHKLAKEFADKKYFLGYPERKEGFVAGYNQSLEDNLAKKFTIEDITKAYIQGGFDGNAMVRKLYKEIKSYNSAEDYVQFLNEKKIEWDVEIEMVVDYSSDFGGKYYEADSCKMKIVDGYINILKIS